jgi:dihydroflavonol-4-reductase
MKIFLTGATGFVGHHAARALAAQGAELRLLVRKTSNLDNLHGLRAETHVGDLSDPATIKPALEGCDAVMHVAADYRLWIPDPAEMYKANVEGTRELLRLAREADVPRFVYTSSVATMGFRKDNVVINEDSPVSLKSMVGHYKRSKYLAEQEALEAAAKGQKVVILNPTTPVGAYDRKPTPTGRIILDFLNGKFPAYMDTGLNLVDVEEIARTHVAALTTGQFGRRYILGGENLTLKQILDKLSELSGVPSPTMKIPFMVAAMYAFFEETITGKIRKKEPRATLEEVRMGRKKMYASSARAQQELGFRIQPVMPALRAAVEWFAENGYVPASKPGAAR